MSSSNFGVELRDVLLKFGGHGQHRRAALGSEGGEGLEVLVAFETGHAALVEVRRVDHGLDGQQAPVDQNVLVLVGELEAARGLLALQMGEQGFAHLHLALVLLVAAFGVLFRALETALHDLHVREDELQIEGLRVAHGVGLFEKDAVVVEAAHDLDQRVDHADGLEDLAPLAAGGDARHVHELDRGGGVFLRVVVFGQPVEPLVRHLGGADVRLGGGVGIAAGLGLRAGQRVEQRRLADIRQTHDPQFHISSHLLQKSAVWKSRVST